MSLEERLTKIRDSPKLENQQQTAIVLRAVEDTLREQNASNTPTAYFAALLALLGQNVSPTTGIANKPLTQSVVYLLDLISPHVPPALLKAKFSQILASLAPTLTHEEAEAPLIRAAIGVLETLLVAQDAQAWTLPQAQASPRAALSGLILLATDSRPKIRKKAQDAAAKVLQNPPPSPNLDHPAADMCADTALAKLQEVADITLLGKKPKGARSSDQGSSELIHTVHLVRTVATACGGWPSRKIDALCELLLNICRSNNDFLTKSAFDVFEVIFTGMARDPTKASSKLPRLLEVITEMQPSRNDSQLLPPWIAVLARGYDVSAQLEPQETFDKLPAVFELVSSFLSSSSHNIRISSAECLKSFLSTCIPDSVIIEPSIYDEKSLGKIAKQVSRLLTAQYRASWQEAFTVAEAAFENFRFRATPALDDVVATIGELRANEAFNGKKEADVVLSRAIKSMGPETFLRILPLNLANPKKNDIGRAWLLPLLRTSITNTELRHFRQEMVGLSEAMFERIAKAGVQGVEQSVETKVFQTVIAQAWSCFPGYCDLCTDVKDTFDQSFAEMLSNLLYQQPDLRQDICRSLQNLIESNQAILDLPPDQERLLALQRISKDEARANLAHLSTFTANLLAVLFNVYSQTLPNSRGQILHCIDAYLGISPEKDLIDTFQRVVTMLEAAFIEAKAEHNNNQSLRKGQPKPESSKKAHNELPPTTHTLLDLLITMSVHLPRSLYANLFAQTSILISQPTFDPALQKKAYKLIPRLSSTPEGLAALTERSSELQALLLSAAEQTTVPARKDRLAALLVVIGTLPNSDLHFIPSVLPEIAIATREVNERARSLAFDLLAEAGERFATAPEGTMVRNRLVPNMPPDAPDATANLDEYITMVSAGLAATSPHVVAATVVALARVLFAFHTRISTETTHELISTVELLLQSKNREIVRAVLGFVKVEVVVVPTNVLEERLKTLIPGLLGWSKEHKARLRSKVKNILDRCIRKCGAQAVERYCPEEDRALVKNVRKTRERAKRKKAGKDDEMEDADADGADGDAQQPRREFASEFDEAVYGSDEDSDDNEDEEMGGHGSNRTGKGKSHRGETFIHEDDDEPLDLLDKRALGHISSTRPAAPRQVKKTKAKTDLDGKLILGSSSSDDDDDDSDEGGNDTSMRDDGMISVADGVNAYVDAIKSRHAPTVNARGQYKFKNVGAKGGNDDEMDLDLNQDDLRSAQKQNGPRSPGHKRRGSSGSGHGAGGHRGHGGGDFRGQRRGLGMEKRRSSGGPTGISKPSSSFRGRGGGRGRGRGRR